jgi:peptide/nickel transport system permease protein
MTAFLIRRILQAGAALLAMSALVFIGVYAIGNPVEIFVGSQADPAEIARTVAALGLDKPLWEQYLLFVRHALSGDLGRSFAQGVPALPLVLERMPATMELAVCALLMSIVIGIPLGLIAGMRPDSWWGHTIMAGSILGFSLPTFWVGLMLIMLFGVQLGWLPASGRGATSEVLGIQLSVFSVDGWRHLLLPAINLALYKLSLVIRLTRSGTREALAQDYVKFARARGLRARRIIGVHVLKNILVPILTVIGLEFGSLIAFAVVTESIFAWPGMGKLLIDSITVLDRPVIVAYLMIVVVIFVLINLVVDLLYSALDPRVRMAGEGA